MEIDLVERFYHQLWNRHDKSLVPELLHEDFCFRGSLGTESVGHAAFIEYLDRVHTALGNYRCTIDELVSEPPKVFARMTFCGLHRGALMGVSATGQHLSWEGAALFHFRDGRIASLWVLGDLLTLSRQLRAGN